MRSIRDGDPPVEAIVQLSKVVQEIQKKDETFRIAPPQSLCGRVMNVFVWEETQWSYVKATCRVGGFLRIRNGSYSQQFWNQEKSEYEFSAYYLLSTTLNRPIDTTNSGTAFSDPET